MTGLTRTVSDDDTPFRIHAVLRLTTFGGVLLRQDGEPHVGAASQRRRLALLVLVAAAGARPVSRDKLLGILWPDVSEERARHALRQALHALQQAIGTDDLFIGTTALQLNPAVITSDLQEIEEAAEANAHQRVVALYKGPFLDGFVVSDAPEFEHWADAQRARYAQLHTAALEALATESTARGDRAAAVVWWRRLAAEHPVSARYALGLMRALADAGDRTGALQFATVHEAVVRQQLGAEPDGAVAQLVDQLRAGEDDLAAVRSSAQVAAGLRAEAVRATARDRRLAWLERTLGSRFDIDAVASRPVVGSIVGYSAFDRGRRVPVEIHLLDTGVSAIADVEQLVSALERVELLRDPHVAPLYEHGLADNVLYYVVSRPEGVSLRDRLARERQLPLGEALGIADGIAAALQHAHERGVRHGDLRPKHVFVSGSECVVAGLGIADAVRSATAHDRTSTAIRIGSPAYQSPEQFTGDPSSSDPRSDLYGLGCMLFEMLAGEVPFASGNPAHLVSAKFTSPVPSVRERRDSVSPELDAVVKRCLAKSPSDRFRDAAELRAALATVLAAASA